MKVCSMTPYWIDRSTATSNDLDLDGLFLLTGMYVYECLYIYVYIYIYICM
jgi:hypothetical protein